MISGSSASFVEWILWQMFPPALLGAFGSALAHDARIAPVHRRNSGATAIERELVDPLFPEEDMQRGPRERCCSNSSSIRMMKPFHMLSEVPTAIPL